MKPRELSSFRFPSGTCIAHAQPAVHRPATLESPAIEVMTDLTLVRAATVRPDVSLSQAEQQMIQQGIRLLFVVSAAPCVDGIVTAADLQGDKPMRLVQQRQLRREDICVADVMCSLSDLDVVDLQMLSRVTVADVISTLQKFGRPHLLVVEAASPERSARIRGLISHSQVERQLQLALPMVPIATTFAEIEQALV